MSRWADSISEIVSGSTGAGGVSAGSVGVGSWGTSVVVATVDSGDVESTVVVVSAAGVVVVVEVASGATLVVVVVSAVVVVSGVAATVVDGAGVSTTPVAGADVVGVGSWSDADTIAAGASANVTITGSRTERNIIVGSAAGDRRRRRNRSWSTDVRGPDSVGSQTRDH
jgi:hypothetical protein